LWPILHRRCIPIHAVDDLLPVFLMSLASLPELKQMSGLDLEESSVNKLF
jgi:hypothetical protein